MGNRTAHREREGGGGGEREERGGGGGEAGLSQLNS